MHPEALSDNLKVILATPLPVAGFYLAGGTALALQLGHRISIDLDWMGPEPISRTLLGSIEKTYKDRTLDVRVNNADELTFLIDGIKITFLHYPFPLSFPTVAFDNVAMADIRDIASMKAYAIGRRATYKDYVDVYFIIKHGISLEEIISFAQKKFESVFDPRLFLEQLIYFGDIFDTNIQFLQGSIKKDDLEKFFEEEVGKIKLT